MFLLVQKGHYCVIKIRQQRSFVYDNGILLLYEHPCLGITELHSGLEPNPNPGVKWDSVKHVFDYLLTRYILRFSLQTARLGPC